MRWAFETIYSRPLITIECNKRPLRCILDTGYPGTIWMSRDMSARYEIATGEQDYYAATASGIEAQYFLGYARVVIDPIVFDSLPIDVHTGIYAEHALLGTRALRNFRVILDFKDEFTDFQYID
ncbi:MAG: retroviral-like aspartic protease family protein [Minisyncoccia bacterium]